MRLRLILVLLCLSVFKPLVYAQNQESMVGTDFWLGFMDNRLLPFLGNQAVNGPCFLSLHISAKEATTGLVSIANTGWSIPFVVQASSTVIVEVPESLARHIDFNTIQNKAIHVESKKNVSVVAFNRIAYSADATSILPVKYLGNDYMLNTYNAISAPALGYSEFLVVATADSTVVEITPNTSLLGGYSAGSTYSVVLNKGESYQNRASNVYTDLTGTVIKGAASNGTCKAFAVFVGSQGTYIPAGCSAGDHLFDQSIPTSEWGNEYYLASFAHTGYYGYRVTAKYNGTVVTTNVTGTNTLNAGQSLFIHTISSPRRIISNLPIQVSKIMMGIDCSSNVYGDPAIMSINSRDQILKEVFFTPLQTDVIDTHYLEINVPTVHKNTIYLDGVLIPDSLFQTIGFYPEMSLAYIPVSPTPHHVKSEHGFHAYSYGVGQAESYVLNLGYHKNTDEIFISQTTCMSGAGQITAPANITDVWWSSISAPEDTIGSGPTLTIPAPVQNNIYLSNGTSTLTGCPTTTYRDVQSSTPPTITVSASKDTVCSLSEISLSLVSDQAIATAEITWFPEGLITSSNGTEATAFVLESGWYGVTVASGSPLFCYTASDSVYVEVSSNSSPITGSISSESNLLCFGDSTELHVGLLSTWAVDLFNDSINGTMWDTVVGGSISSDCESFSGSSVHMNGGVDRILETQAIDFSSGGEISFYLYTGNAAFPCDQTDNNEDIQLQYSLNNGATWTTFKTLYEYNYHTLSQVEVEIPAAAQTVSTKLRLIQPTFTAQDEDIWTVDNFVVYLNTTSTAISWTSSGNTLNANTLDPTIYTDSSAWYYVSVGDPFCGFSDSIFIKADNFTVAVSLDSNSCTDQTLHAIPNDSDPYCYVWNTGQWNVFSDSSSIQVSSQVSGNYDVSVLSTEGCIFQDTVQVVAYSHLTTYSGDLSGGCIGDTQSVTAYSLDWIIDDFDLDTVNLSLWDTIYNGSLNTNCGSMSGDALHFGGLGSPLAMTYPLNITNGSVIQFYLTYGGGGNMNCTAPNSNKLVRLSYSIDNGVTWNYLEYFPIISGYQYYEIPFPLAAQTTNTILKWDQNGTGLYGFGNWALDQLKISTSSAPMSYTWTDGNNMVLSSTNSVSYTPDSTTYLYLEAVNSLNGCSQKDSLLITADGDFALGLNDTLLCGNQAFSYSFPYSTTDGYLYNWSTDLGSSSVTDDSVYVINLNPSPSINNNYTDRVITVEVTSPNGCIQRDTSVVTLFNLNYYGINFDSTLNVCAGSPLAVSGELYQRVFYEQFASFYNINVNNLFSYLGGMAISSLGCTSTITNTSQVGFYYSTNRRLVTNNIDCSNGGYFEFEFNYGNNSGNYACDAPEVGEEVYVEYSIDNGFTWTHLRTLEVIDFPVWDLVKIPIPPAAQVSQLKIRWDQPVYSANYEDTWFIENLKYYRTYQGELMNYSWALDGNVISTDSTLTLPSIQGSTLILTMMDTLGYCTNFTDTIQFNSFSVDLPADTTMCDLLGFQINGTTSASTPYSVTWNNTNLSPSDSISAAFTTGVTQDSTFSIALEVYQQGCTYSDTMIINTFSNPVVVPISQATICSGTVIPIDLTGATNITWSPDSTVLNSTSTNPILAPLDDEQYTLVYQAGANNCSFSHDIFVEVVNSPTLLLPDSMSFCSNDSVGVIPTVFSAANDHLWSTGDTSIVIFAQTSGTYYLTESNFCGSANDSVYISEVTQSLNLISQTEICEGSSVLIDMTGASNIIWTPSNTVINASTTSPELAPQSDQQYTVSFFDANGCTYTEDIFVGVNYVPAMTLPDSLTFCEYDSVQIVPITFSATNDFSWSTGDTTTTIYTFSPGTYYLTESNFCGSATDSVYISEAIQSLNIISQTEICEGSSVLIDMTGASNIIWTPSNTVINSSTTNPELAPQSDQQYTVSFFDANGCAYTEDIFVGVNYAPTTTLPDSLNFCEDDSVQIVPISFSATDDFSWTTGDTTTTIYVSSPGMYELTTSNSCGTDLDATYITETMLNPTATQTLNALTTDANWDSYQWLDCSDSSLILGENGQTFNFLSSGSYAVIVESQLCKDTSECYLVNWVELSELQSDAEISIHPNPFDDVTTIRIKGGGAENYFIELTDMTGRVVREFVTNGNSTVLLKKEALQAGVYYLRLMINDGSYFRSVPIVIN